MIDVCPVGALTSKPFRYSARTWELTRRKSVSPHDGVGANLIVQMKNNRVMRVLPLENEAVNECWISDKDRFSYEAVNSAERLTKPMIRQNGEWHEVDWKTALDYVADSFKKIAASHGTDAIGMLASPHSTLEELFLLKSLANGIGTPNIDYRLRQSDFSGEVQGGNGVRWLGLPIADLNLVDRALIIGAHLRRDQPLLAGRLRQAAKNGARIGFLGASADDSLIVGAHRVVAAPSAWLAELTSIARAVAAVRGVELPTGFGSSDDVTPSDDARRAAESFVAGEKTVVLLGNDALHHPEFTKLHALAAWIAENSGATLGFLTEAANTVGAQLVDALPGANGLDAAAMFAQPRQAYVLMNVEPEFDSSDAAVALSAMSKAGLVVSLSAFKHAADYADVLLPIAPFTETAGTFVNCEGRVQPFNGVAPPLGETRPAWKVLRVLGNLFNVPGFDYESIEQVRKAALLGIDIDARLGNGTRTPVVAGTAPEVEEGRYERLPDVPIYHADALVRRAESLQLTVAAKQAVRASLPAELFDRLGVAKGDAVRVTQGGLSVTLPAYRDAKLAPNVVRVSAATPASAALGSLFGTLVVEKA
jgi:NADH-quinone oxidoreductase subunit G